MNPKTDPRYLPLIFQSIPHGIFTVDGNGLISAFNKAAEDITGYGASEAIGKRCKDIFQADICERDCPLQHSVHTMEKIDDRQAIIRTRSGEKRIISICTAAITNASGAIIGGVEMFRDISQLEELRKQLQHSYGLGDIVTKNSTMVEILDRLPLYADSTSTVLIEGPSGTGKELVARALHNLSPRTNKPFIAVNCAALPDNLLESELFGYVKGAFTDARKDKPGRFQLAHTGSIFLDEIGDISLPMQTKLLRVLQEREFEPLGSIKNVKVDLRVIAATNSNLEEKVKQGLFREDLFYRLHVIRIRLPPLSQRREDIPILVAHFIESFNHLLNRKIDRISNRALCALMGAPLQGNVRELKNAIEYAFVMCRDVTIDIQHLPPQYSTYEAPILKEIDGGLLNTAEANVIQAVLNRNQGNRIKTALELGISRNTLWRKMKRFGIGGPHPPNWAKTFGGETY